MQAVFRNFIYSVQEGKGCTFSWDSLNPSRSSSHRKLLLKERICSLEEQILSFKSNPQIWSDTISPIKVKNKNVFFICQSVWKMSGKKSGKRQGILKWMISDNPELVTDFNTKSSDEISMIMISYETIKYNIFNVYSEFDRVILQVYAFIEYRLCF